MFQMTRTNKRGFGVLETTEQKVTFRFYNYYVMQILIFLLNESFYGYV